MRVLQGGQALVLVLLSLAVVLTLVLYILSRSVTDISVSSREEEAVRAFSAAEAGVEKALIVGSSLGSTEVGNAKYSADVVNTAEGQNSFNYPILLDSGDTATLWFAAHDADGNITCSLPSKPCFSGNTLKICWGKPGTSDSTPTTPAIEVSVFYNDAGVYKIGRAAFDPSSSRAISNSFSSIDVGSCDIAGTSYAFQKTMDLSSIGATGTLMFARIRMLYNSGELHNVGFDVDFSGNGLLPAQGITISSSGSAGSSNRKLDVFEGWPEAPGVFDYAIYSSTGLTK